MIQLSFSTINNCLQLENSHNWVNKINGAKVPDNEFFKNGHRLHSIIQEHLSGKKPHPKLKGINYTFPIVEEKDFDERCKFTFTIKSTAKEQLALLTSKELPAVGRGFLISDIKGEYEIRGFLDAQDPENKRFGEIKTGASTMWSLQKFISSYQRKIYALAKPEYTEGVLITCLDDSQWGTTPPKVYKVELTEQDRKDALNWILRGIKILESGDYTGGLDENGKCTNYRCYYGINCEFK